MQRAPWAAFFKAWILHGKRSYLNLLQAARLLAAFKEFKRREAVGLASFYANKLAALEVSLVLARNSQFFAIHHIEISSHQGMTLCLCLQEALLAARDKLFALAEQAAAMAAAGPAAAAAVAAEGGVEGISAETAAAAVAGAAGGDPMSQELKESLDHTTKIEKEVCVHAATGLSHR